MPLQRIFNSTNFVAIYYSFIILLELTPDPYPKHILGRDVNNKLQHFAAVLQIMNYVLLKILQLY